jgi:ketosteroid isomerase-like protein
VFALGTVLLLIGGFLWWQAANPPLTAEQQITASLDDAADALQKRSAAGVLRHLAPDFTWNNTSRDEFSSLLKGSLFQARDVQIRRSNEKVVVNGDEATSTGSFRATYRTTPNGDITTQNGTYTTRWKMLDSGWKMVAIEGAAPAISE